MSIALQTDARELSFHPASGLSFRGQHAGRRVVRQRWSSPFRFEQLEDRNLLAGIAQTAEVVSTAPIDQPFLSLEFDSTSDRLFGITIVGSGAEQGLGFVEVDPATGAQTLLNAFPPVGSSNPFRIVQGVEALDPVNDRYFVSALLGSQLEPHLVSISTATGAILVAAPVDRSFVSFEFDSTSGALFGFTSVDDGPNQAIVFVDVNAATGDQTLLHQFPPVGGSDRFSIVQGVEALDPVNHRYFVSASVGDSFLPHLVALSTQTGEILSAVPVERGFVSLEFDSTSGTLFGFTSVHDGDAQAIAFVEVNPASGEQTLLHEFPPVGATDRFSMVQGVEAWDRVDQRYFVSASLADQPTPQLVAIRPVLVQSVDIDIKPGGEPNVINVANNGKIAVAILSTAEFDASMVIASTVLFAGAAVDHWAMDDVDGDGDLDMVLHFRTQATSLRAIYAQLVADDINEDGVLDSNRQTAEVSLTGQTASEDFFEGFDEAELFLSGKALRTLLDELAAAGAI